MAIERPITEGKIRKVSFWVWPDKILSWTFPGQEGKNLKVNVYSRANKIRLYLNNNIIGEKETNDDFTISFVVPIQPGELKAVEMVDDGEGNVVYDSDRKIDITVKGEGGRLSHRVRHRPTIWKALVP